MYRKKDNTQLEFENFYLPFGGKLRSNNRWVQLAKLIPWEKLEDHYADLFSEDQGAPAKSFRMALGALIIKEKLNITDEETVEQIRENHYLQYMIGLQEYKDEVPFDPSMMVHFRKRLSSKILADINEVIVKAAIKQDNDDDDSTDQKQTRETSSLEETDTGNSGIMMVDASVAPADIAYPTDLNLLNESREKLEDVIDTLYEAVAENISKPRTYRQIARRDYLAVAKRRRTGTKMIRKAIKRQLQYIHRDLKHVENLLQQQGTELDLMFALLFVEKHPLMLSLEQRSWSHASTDIMCWKTFAGTM